MACLPWICRHGNPVLTLKRDSEQTARQVLELGVWPQLPSRVGAGREAPAGPGDARPSLEARTPDTPESLPITGFHALEPRPPGGYELPGIFR